MNMTEKTYQFICDYIEKNKYPPTVREICASLNFDSTSTAFYHLKKLEKLGKISRNENKNRAIELNEPTIPSITLPLLGTIAAGQPILAEENLTEKIIISENMFSGNNMFVLKVKGDSMINVGIYDGDHIIVHKQNTARNGDLVVALVDDSATVKTFYKEKGHFRLQPENDTMEPIIVNEVEILGTVAGLYRRY